MSEKFAIDFVNLMPSTPAPMFLWLLKKYMERDGHIAVTQRFLQYYFPEPKPFSDWISENGYQFQPCLHGHVHITEANGRGEA